MRFKQYLKEAQFDPEDLEHKARALVTDGMREGLHYKTRSDGAVDIDNHERSEVATPNPKSVIEISTDKFEDGELPVQLGLINSSTVSISSYKSSQQNGSGDYDAGPIVHIKSLKNWPTDVAGYLTVEGIEVSSLDGFPKAAEVGIFNCIGFTDVSGLNNETLGFFMINDTDIDSFRGFPHTVKELNICRNKKLTSLVGIDDYVKECKEIYLSPSYITEGGLGLLKIHGLTSVNLAERSGDRCAEALTIISKYLGKPDQIFECQQELIEKDLEEFAQ